MQQEDSVDNIVLIFPLKIPHLCKDVTEAWLMIPHAGQPESHFVHSICLRSNISQEQHLVQAGLAASDFHCCCRSSQVNYICIEPKIITKVI